MKITLTSNPSYLTQVERDLLAIQLLETSFIVLGRIRKYAEDNGIQLTDSLQIEALLAKARNLIQELDEPELDIMNRRKVTDLGELNGTDEEVTEPA